MSNLSNLFISQSFYGMVNLENSLEPLVSASGDVELQDGLGENLGLRINAQTKEFTIVNNFKVDGNADFNGDVDISGSLTHTGSIDIVGDLTIQGDVTANVGNFDTVNARLLNITEESASVIFSSGSNVLGDEETDRQDLIGQVIVSGTLGIEGNSAFTGSLTVSNEISSSTLNGIGNVTSYSSSVDDRLVQLEVSSGSQDSQLSNLENFTASQENINGGYNSFTSSYFTDSASFDNRIDQLESDTGSQDSRLDSLEAFTGSQETLNGFYNSFTASNGNDSLNTFTSSYYIDSASFDLRLDQQEAFSSSLVQDFVSTPDFNSYTQSTDIRLNNLELETSSIDNRLDNIELTTSSLQVEIDGLSSLTGSYATTGSNVFDGDNVFSGSVQGDIHTISIASSTASIDCSQGNFFTLTLPSGSTHLDATNIKAGMTITLKTTQPATGSGVFEISQNIKQPSGAPLVLTPEVNAEDIITFVSYDTTSLYGVSSLNFN